MYKNQLQELAQRSCFNLPSYACIREGPDHAPRFRASVNFNGEIFEGPSYCHTLRQAEHAAAEVALNTLSTRGPSRSLAARVLDETGVFKNLLQETAHRAGLNLPVYTTVRSGPGHLPVFTCTVELAGMNFTGEPAKTKKQAEKNAAMAAWSSLKQLPNLGSLSQSNKETESNEEQEQVVVAKVLSNFKPKDENKPIRRRKMMLGYRDNSSISSPNNTSQYQKYQPLDPLLDVSSIYPTQQHQQQNSCFLALPTPSRILQQMPTFQQSITAASQDQSPSKDSISSNNNKNPSLYSSNRPIPVHIRSKSQIRIQEIPPPLEEHQKDEEEWLGGRSDVKGKQTEIGSSSANFGASSTSISPFVLPQTPNFNPASAENRTQQPQIRTRPFRLSTPMPAPIRTAPGIPRPRFLHSSEFHLHSIAPAVHIRSVIPVCAAPPTKPPSNPPTAQKKETSISASAPASPTTEEVSLASSMLDKLQL
ncbi:double-stranded RNA-binding protein 3-like [Magnolia sinica]|uniref:double-stranded RNA-binding protein 3-like n=1 Tax=Magnolia sinica TaxID=86752 RepID=UPI00265A5E91|nr:double-stranded RNA-binding protein 3-like [Magnolia sinica]